MIIPSDLIMQGDRICPDYNKCPYGHKHIVEEIENCRDLRCPHEYPHNSHDCNQSHCCPHCIPVEEANIVIGVPNE